MNSDQYDIAIIGGGIIGLSTAMHILQKRPTLKVVVVEKENTLAKHQTGNNSGVIHSGIYYKPGSWKSEFCVSGVTKIKEFCDDNEIEYVECGKTIVATSENELGRLQDLYERGQANGVPGLEMIGPERLQEIEPHVAGVQALWSPKTGIVDYVKITNRYADIFQENGAHGLKITGAGGGGCLILPLLNPTDQHVQSVVKTLHHHGYTCFVTKIGQPGLQCTFYDV